MKNKEKFANEIFDIAISVARVGVNKDTKIPQSCENLSCQDCLFFNAWPCYSEIKKWMEGEYKEEKVFTEEEKTIIRILDRIEWVARDSNGEVYGYCDEKPQKAEKAWRVVLPNSRFIKISSFNAYSSNSILFNCIKWEDEEPTSREEILR